MLTAKNDFFPISKLFSKRINFFPPIPKLCYNKERVKLKFSDQYDLSVITSL